MDDSVTGGASDSMRTYIFAALIGVCFGITIAEIRIKKLKKQLLTVAVAD